MPCYKMLSITAHFVFISVFILRWHHSIHLLEVFGEIAWIVEAHLISHLCNSQLALAQQLLSMAQTYLTDKLRGGQVGDGCQLLL